MGLNLDNILKAMHNSVIEAQKLTEQQHVRMLNRYFFLDKTKEDFSPEQIGRPKTVSIQLPYLNSDNVIEYSEVDIPMISLSPPTSIKIKNMKISFEAQLAGFEEQQPKKKGFSLNIFKGKDKDKDKNVLEEELNEKEPESHQGPLMIDLKNSRNSSGNGVMAKIEIEFENGDAPESVARINDQIIRTFPF